MLCEIMITRFPCLSNVLIVYLEAQKILIRINQLPNQTYPSKKILKTKDTDILKTAKKQPIGDLHEDK